MAVHYQIRERTFSKQGDLMSFVNGRMMLKVAMQSASVTAMDVIQWRN